MGAPHDHLAALQTIGATLDRAPITAPVDLQGRARELFDALAAGHTSRPWNAAHAFALSDYCRLSVLWSDQMAAIETEGATVGAKPNPRFATLRALSMERNRLARLLGMAVGVSDAYLAKSTGNNARTNALSASMARAQEQDPEGFLS